MHRQADGTFTLVTHSGLRHEVVTNLSTYLAFLNVETPQSKHNSIARPTRVGPDGREEVASRGPCREKSALLNQQHHHRLLQTRLGRAWDHSPLHRQATGLMSVLALRSPIIRVPKAEADVRRGAPHLRPLFDSRRTAFCDRRLGHFLFRREDGLQIVVSVMVIVEVVVVVVEGVVTWTDGRIPHLEGGAGTAGLATQGHTVTRDRSKIGVGVAVVVHPQGQAKVRQTLTHPPTAAALRGLTTVVVANRGPAKERAELRSTGLDHRLPYAVEGLPPTPRRVQRRQPTRRASCIRREHAGWTISNNRLEYRRVSGGTWYRAAAAVVAALETAVGAEYRLAGATFHHQR